MRFPHGLRALNHRDFRRFYAAQLLALVGGWMQTVAQAWLVLQLTDSPFKLGLISTLQFSPILMFSLVAGAVADRLPKRGLLVTTQTTLACQALLLGALVSTAGSSTGQLPFSALFSASGMPSTSPPRSRSSWALAARA